MSDSEKIKADSWNERVTPNLEALSRWFSAPEWIEMLAPYLRQVEQRLMDKLISSEDRTREQERFLAGEIANLREIIAIPQIIQHQIKQATENKKASKSRNEVSGY